MNKVGGAIQGIENPYVFGIGIANLSGFFAEYGVVGVALMNQLNNCIFGSLVHLRDKFVLPFHLYFQSVELTGLARDDVAGFASRFDGRVE